MLSAAARRAAPRTLGRRLNSSSSSSKNTLENAQAAATKAFSRAQELAGPLAGRVATAAGPLGARASSLLGAYREPVLYQLSVARELAKQVYIAENLAPPRSFGAVADAYKSAFATVSSPLFWRTVIESGLWAKLGIYALEAYTIFKIGEIIGRRKLVGYKLEH